MNQLDPVPSRSKVLDATSNLSDSWYRWLRALRQILNSISAQTGTQAHIPNNLTNADTGKLFWASDYNHFLTWNGTAWGWAPGELGSGFAVLFPVNPPTAVGWHLCDGTMQKQLNADGTTSNILLPTIANTYFRL